MNLRSNKTSLIAVSLGVPLTLLAGFWAPDLLGLHVGPSFRYLGLLLALMASCAFLYAFLRSIAAANETDPASLIQKTVMESTIYSVITVDLNGIITSFNAGAERLLGYSRDEVIGRCSPVEAFHLPSELEARAAELTRSLGRPIRPGRCVFIEPIKASGIEEREWTYLRKDGSHVRVVLSVTPLNHLGQLIGYVGIAADITSRKEAEAAVRESEERFRRAFEYTGIGMALVDESARWLRVNPALCRILGYSADELHELTCYDVTFPEDRSFCPSAMEQLKSGRSSFCQVEKRYVKKTGELVWAQVSLSLAQDHAGDEIHFVAQIEDISRRKELDVNLSKARDEALETSRLKSEFLASMSHEIRTPMNAVIGMARLMKDTPLDEDQKKMNEVLLSCAESLLGLLNDILDFSKIEAGRMRIEFDDYDLVELVAQTCEMFSAPAAAKGLLVRREVPSGFPPRHRGDASRVRQVLANLLGNAVKFTQKGEVCVRLSLVQGARNSCVRIEVLDTGIGIPDTAMRRLFRAFTQVDGSTTRSYGGTGLGLAISKQLVELMGGTIGVDSLPGSGSTFWLQLPTQYVPAENRTPSSVPSDSKSPFLLPAKHRVLIVEDNAPNQLVMKLSLKKKGCDVEVANNGIEALDRLTRGNFDVIVMDCQMPKLDGYETTRRIRTGSVASVNPQIPIIAVTAFAMAGDRDRCMGVGMNEYVPKPVREQALADAFKRCGFPLD